MAKKKKKGKRQRVETRPDAPVAKREPKATPRDADETPSTSGGSQSLPPTKKSTLPPELAHDDREINTHTLIRYVMITGGFVVFAMISAFYLNQAFTNSELATHTPPLPMATSLPTAPPEPRLQRAPQIGLADYDAQEKKELDSYGWVDEREGIVQIPIERAMELTVQRGLPARERPEDVGPKVSQPTDASLEPGGPR